MYLSSTTEHSHSKYLNLKICIYASFFKHVLSQIKTIDKKTKRKMILVEEDIGVSGFYFMVNCLEDEDIGVFDFYFVCAHIK